MGAVCEIVQKSPCPAQTRSAWEVTVLFLGRKQKPTRKKNTLKKKKEKKKEAKETSKSSKGVSSASQSSRVRTPLSSLGDFSRERDAHRDSQEELHQNHSP